MAYSGESRSGHIDRKTIDAAIEKYKVVKLKSGDTSTVQKVTAASDHYLVYGRAMEARTSANITSGLSKIDVEVPKNGDKITLIASAAMATVRVPVGPAADGEIAALTANATPTDQFQLGTLLETAAGADSEVLVRWDPKWIQY